MIKKRKRNSYTEVCALGKHTHMSTNRAQKIIDQIKFTNVATKKDLCY